MSDRDKKRTEFTISMDEAPEFLRRVSNQLDSGIITIGGEALNARLLKSLKISMRLEEDGRLQVKYKVQAPRSFNWKATQPSNVIEKGKPLQPLAKKFAD